jgi:hypothetical protein
MTTVPLANVRLIRDYALTSVKRTKAEIVELLESGDRDWSRLRAAVAEYTQSQDAADVLGGMVRLEGFKESGQ